MSIHKVRYPRIIISSILRTRPKRLTQWNYSVLVWDAGKAYKFQTWPEDRGYTVSSSGRNNVRSSFNFRSFFLNWLHIIPCDQYAWPITFAWLRNSSVHEGTLDERLGLSSSVPCCWVQLFIRFLFFQCSLLLSSVVYTFLVLPVFLVAEFSCLYVSCIAWQLYRLLALIIAHYEERWCLTGGSGRRQEAASEFTLHSRSGDASVIAITRRCRGWTALVSARVKIQLKRKACSEFVQRIRGSKNFSDKWPDDRRRQLGQVKQRLWPCPKWLAH